MVQRTKARVKKRTPDRDLEMDQANAARIITAATDKAAAIVSEAATKAASLVAEAAAKAASTVDTTAASVASSNSVRSQIAAEAAHAAITELTSGPVLQDIVNKAVDMGLERLGFKINDKEAMQENMRHLSDWVDTMKIIRTRGIGAAVFGLVTFLLSAIGYGVMVMLRSPPTH